MDTKADTTEPYGLIVAIYPPKLCVPDNEHDNPTSESLAQLLGNRNFIWNDIAPVSPKGLSRDFDYETFFEDIRTRSELALELILKWWARAQNEIAEFTTKFKGKKLVLVWAGTIANMAHKWLVELSFISSEGDINYKFKIDRVIVVSHDNYISILSAPHPSAHLHSKESKPDFRSSYLIFGELVKTEHKSPSSLLKSVDKEVAERIRINIKNFNKLCTPHNSGYLDIALRHMRLTLWDESLPNLLVLKERLGDLNFLRLCHYSIQLQCKHKSFVDNVLDFYNTMSSTLFWMFICDSVVLRLKDKHFCKEVNDLRESLGDQLFGQVFHDSFAARLSSDGYTEKVSDLRESLGDQLFGRVFTRSFAARLSSDGYIEKVNDLRESLGDDVFAKSFQGPFAAGLSREGFSAALSLLEITLGRELFLRVIKGHCVPTYLDRPDWINSLVVVQMLLEGSDQALVNIVQGNCTCYITSEAFRQELKKWIDDLGPDRVGSIFKTSLSTHIFQLNKFREYLKTCNTWTDKMFTKFSATLDSKDLTREVEEKVWLGIFKSENNEMGKAKKTYNTQKQFNKEEKEEIKRRNVKGAKDYMSRPALAKLYSTTVDVIRNIIVGSRN